MGRKLLSTIGGWLPALCLALAPQIVTAQNFDFASIQSRLQKSAVILKLQIEFSFGMQTNEHEQSLLGTVVTPDGLAVFDGSILNEDALFDPMPSFSVKATPTRITARTLDDREYEAEFVGVDQLTGLGFARLKTEDAKFEPMQFVSGRKFKIGDWLALYTLLPEFVSPRLTADIAMVSSLLTAPEDFTLTVGFNTLELASVLFDQTGRPVGVLGALVDPSGGMSDEFGQLEMPLLGVVTAEKLQKLIANPPQKGKVDRAWLGITLQALTPDIASFLGIDVQGGIVVNEVVKDSPADRYGLQVGDVIYAVNGQPLDVDREEKISVFQRQIASMGAGTSVELSVLRPGDENVDTLQVLAQLDAAPLAAADAEEYESVDLEFKVRDLVFSDYMHFNVQQGEFSGVVVSEIKEGGLAYVGGLHLGDVIQRVDGSEINGTADFESVLEQLRTEKPREVILFVWRFHQTMFVNVKTDWQ